MPQTLERQHTNPLGYPELDVASFTPLGDRILLQWDESHDEIKMGKLRLVRPETHKGQHYTGTVLSCGSFVDPDIKPGQRLFFEQFGGFTKLFDPKYGRLALIRESDAKAVVPKRAKIESDSGDYDYDK